MLKFITQVCLCAALLLLSTNPATAGIVYELSLPASGNVDAIRVQVTVPTFITGPLFVIDGNDSEFTSFSSGSLSLPDHSIGIEALSSVTRIGLSLADNAGLLATLNRDYARDFFVFNRLPDEIGTFTSVAGTIESTGPYQLSRRTPTVELTVSGTPDLNTPGVPEPASVLTTGVGVLVVGTLLRRKLGTSPRRKS